VNSRSDSTSRWAAFFSLCPGFVMILVDTTAVSVATPSIIRDLDTTIGGSLWVTTAYLVAYSVPLLVTGRVGDRFGLRRTYLLGLGLFTAASIGCGSATGIGMLIVLRVVQGFGAALFAPQMMAMIARAFPEEQKGRAMGAWGSVAGFSTMLAPLAAGILIDATNWRAVFFINVPFGLFGAWVGWRHAPAYTPRPQRFDLIGMALVVPGVFFVVIAIQDCGQGSHRVLGLPFLVVLLVGVLLLVGFLRWETRTDSQPLVPLQLFAVRNFALSNIGVAAMGFGIAAVVFPILLLATNVTGLSSLGLGLLLAPMGALPLLIGPLAGPLIERFSLRGVALAGFASFVGGLVWLAATMSPDSTVIGPVMLLGVGIGLAFPALGTGATRALDPVHAGSGMGVYQAAHQLGALLGSAAIALAMQLRVHAQLGPRAGQLPDGPGGGRLDGALAAAYADSMRQALVVPAAVVLLGLVVVAFLSRPRTPAAADVGQDCQRQWVSAAGPGSLVIAREP
jgi:EmrB/QacA subfamily drug resistance transporter